MKKRLMNGKKGTILGDFAGVISDVFQTFPKPLLFIIFFVILLLIGGVIQFSLQIFGVFCDSAKHPVNIGFGTDNFGLISDVPDQNLLGISGKTIQNWNMKIPVVPYVSITFPAAKSVITRCSHRYLNAEVCYSSTNCTNVSDQWFFDGQLCANCTTATIYDYGATMGGAVLDTSNKCIGNATRINDSEKSFWQKTFCSDNPNLFQSCDIPVNYYYDSTLNILRCNSGSNCLNLTIGQQWDQLLEDNGAVYLYPNQSSDNYGDYNNAVGIKCSDNLHPLITLFGIELFNYQLWILLFLCVILGYLYYKIKHN
jgi:hypothetical protein